MYGPDTVWQQEFEESFPYDETESQLEAIEDVKTDMMSNKIMASSPNSPDSSSASVFIPSFTGCAGSW